MFGSNCTQIFSFEYRSSKKGPFSLTLVGTFGDYHYCKDVKHWAVIITSSGQLESSEDWSEICI